MMRDKVIIGICSLKNKISYYKMAYSYGQYQTVVLLDSFQMYLI